MKITTWNINGYRAIQNKGFREWVSTEAPDILCLQEIKVKPEQLTEEQKTVSPYSLIWNPAERPGYSGTATLHNRPVEETILGLGDPRFDVEGRVIQTRQDGFTLFNIYFPNGQRGQDRVDFKLDFYQVLLDLVDPMIQGGEPFMITGDFNTAHREIDLANPKENQKTSGFLPEEREMVDRYMQHGLVDIYRVLYPEKVQYTWWTYITNARARNVGWRIDYFLVSPALVDRVEDVMILDQVLGSDHCPVSLTLR